MGRLNIDLIRMIRTNLYFAEFFPDEDEEEAEGAAPDVDASGQYAFQSNGKWAPSHSTDLLLTRARSGCAPGRFQLWFVNRHAENAIPPPILCIALLPSFKPRPPYAIGSQRLLLTNVPTTLSAAFIGTFSRMVKTQVRYQTT